MEDMLHALPVFGALVFNTGPCLAGYSKLCWLNTIALLLVKTGYGKGGCQVQNERVKPKIQDALSTCLKTPWTWSLQKARLFGGTQNTYSRWEKTDEMQRRTLMGENLELTKEPVQARGYECKPIPMLTIVWYFKSQLISWQPFLLGFCLNSARQMANLAQWANLNLGPGSNSASTEQDFIEKHE